MRAERSNVIYVTIEKHIAKPRWQDSLDILLRQRTFVVVCNLHDQFDREDELSFVIHTFDTDYFAETIIDLCNLAHLAIVVLYDAVNDFIECSSSVGYLYRLFLYSIDEVKEFLFTFGCNIIGEPYDIKYISYQS